MIFADCAQVDQPNRNTLFTLTKIETFQEAFGVKPATNIKNKEK